MISSTTNQQTGSGPKPCTMMQLWIHLEKHGDLRQPRSIHTENLHANRSITPPEARSPCKQASIYIAEDRNMSLKDRSAMLQLSARRKFKEQRIAARLQDLIF
jgi:hypothetical protein